MAGVHLLGISISRYHQQKTIMTTFASEWCLCHDISELISVNTSPCFAEIKKAKKKEKVKLPQSKFNFIKRTVNPKPKSRKINTNFILRICELLLPLRHS